LYGAFTAATERLHLVLDPDDQLDFDEYSGRARIKLGAKAYAAGVAEGRAWSFEAAVQKGLGR
jgi:hypothetical protein